jgi:uncharacterized membrane protein YhaH (DUF805 family)
VLKYRINRPTYWLCNVFVAVILGVLAYFGKLNGGMEMMMVLIGVPRLHDIGRSGWLVGAAIVAEIVVVVAVAIFASMDTLEIVGGLIVLTIAVLGIWLGMIPSQSGANKWGEPPGPGIRFGRRNASLTSRGQPSV